MRGSRQRRLMAGFALAALAALPAAAQEPEKAPPAPDKSRLERNGPYLGVAPGMRDTAPQTVKANAKGAIHLLTWVGFQMQGEGGRVFIQSTDRPAYNLVPAPPDQVVLEFPDTRLLTRNDARRLETGAFPTAVSWVQATQEGGNVTRVTIKLRETVGYDLRQEGNYVLLDFRPPSPATLAPMPTPAAPTSAAN